MSVLVNGVTVPTGTVTPAEPVVSDRLFDTGHLDHDIKGKAVRGGAATFSAEGVAFFLQTASTVVLARLLTPADFGLVGMVTAVTGFAAMFKDAGLSAATVQQPQITRSQVSTLFWVNVALSLAVMMLTVAISPLVASFYGEPRLLWITIALASTFLLGGLSVQHLALLRRQMRFSVIATISVVSMTAGIATGVLIAVLTESYWSLVAIAWVREAVGAVGAWWACRWLPDWPRRGSGALPMLKFGGNLTGFNVLNYFTRNLDNILIGWWSGAGALGLYTKAYGLLMMPITRINRPVGSVMIPVLSRKQDQPGEYIRLYRRAITTLALLGMPLVGWCFLVADELILLMLGDGWQESAPIFRALSLAAMLGTTNVAPGWVYMTLGRTDRQLRWGLISAPVTVVLMVLAVPFGPVAMAAAISLGYLFAWVGGILYCFRGTFLRFSIVLRAIGPSLAGVSLAIVAGWLVRSEASLPGGTITNLLLLSAVYLSTLGAISLVFAPLRRDWAAALKLVYPLLRSKMGHGASSSEAAGVPPGH